MINDVNGAQLTESQISNAKKNVFYRWEHTPYHQHSDCIRIAYEWLRAQNRTKFPVNQNNGKGYLVHLIEDWGRRTISEDDILVAAKLLGLKGSCNNINLSLKRTFPTRKRLIGIKQAGMHPDFVAYSDGYVHFEDSEDERLLEKKYRYSRKYGKRMAGQIFGDEVIIPPNNWWGLSSYDDYQIKPRRFESPRMMSHQRFVYLHPCIEQSVTNINQLPEKSGCYAAIENGEVLYVGESQNINKRCSHHSKIYTNGHSSWRLFFWVTKDHMSLERWLISYLRPTRNVHYQDEKYPRLCGWNGLFREDVEKQLTGKLK